MPARVGSSDAKSGAPASGVRWAGSGRLEEPVTTPRSRWRPRERLTPALQFCGQLQQPALVLACVVAAEQQLTTGGEDGPRHGGGAATVATVGCGQGGAGECSGHLTLPPFGALRRPRCFAAAPEDGTAAWFTLFQT